MADITILMKTMEYFASPKKTKAQLEAEKILKEEEERRRVKTKNNPVPATKTETKPETKPATKTESKPETKPATKTESKPETKPATKTESKPETKSATKTEVKPEKKEDKKDDKKGVVKKVLEKFQMDDGSAGIDTMIGWLFFFLAAYLSWTCNSKTFPGMDQVEKIVRAFVAGLFGFIYLIIYFLFLADQCNKGGRV
jgi:hypothetical protein